jgi:diguanylate cyclase (GGDEF)-like protein
MNSHRSTDQSRFGQLRSRYLSSLPEKLGQLREAWQRLQNNGWRPQHIEPLRGIAHRLAGSAGSYGFQPQGQAAAALEDLLVRFAEAPDQQDLPLQITEGFELLCSRLKELLDTYSEASRSEGHYLPATASRRDFSNYVYLVEQDLEQSDSLSQELRKRGYNLRVFHSLQGVAEAAEQQRPAGVVLDVMCSTEHPACFELARSLAALPPPRPKTILLSNCSDFQSRLAAIHTGANAYLVKPISLAVLTGLLDRMLATEPRTPGRVLIVEDDADVARLYSLSLQQIGIEVAIVSDPAMLIETLVDLRPELILMDLFLPGCNGLDLVQMIRQHCYYAPVPIVVLTSEASPAVRTQALRVGADDYLNKPIDPRLLLEHVLTRLRHFREAAKLTEQDHLTGVYNRNAFVNHMNSEVLRSLRLGTPASLVLIDLDRFQQVNETHGQLIGDAALRRVADKFVRRLRKTDLIGRYSGDAFSLLLPETDGPTARWLLDGMRQSLSSQPMRIGDQEIQLTLSVGISVVEPGLDVREVVISNLLEKLLARAEAALCEAKREGRNRTVLG